MAKIVSKSVDELIDEYWEREMDHNRNVRAVLLDAFDKYNTNQASGFSRSTLSIEAEQEMRQWYFDVLDMKYDAIFDKNRIPESVRYFLPKNHFDNY